MAVSRTKPFAESGSGYRDALIWESVCEQATDGQIIFVTNNTKDFSEDGSSLAPSLIQDLADRSLPPDSVRLLTSLADVVRKYAPEATDVVSIAESFFQTDPGRSDLEEELNASLRKYEGIPYPSRPGELDTVADGLTIEQIYRLEEITITNAVPDGDSTYVVYGTAKALGQGYVRHESASRSDIGAAEVARQLGRIENYVVEQGDLVVIKLVPIIATFAADFATSGAVWNAGVMNIEHV